MDKLKKVEPVPERPVPPLRFLWFSVAVLVAAVLIAVFAPRYYANHPAIAWAVPLVIVALYLRHRGWLTPALALGGVAVVYAATKVASTFGLNLGLPDSAYAVVTGGILVLVAVMEATAVCVHAAWREELKRLAMDPETGLLRPWLTEWYLEKGIEAARRGTALSVVVFGLQEFDRSPSWKNEDPSGLVVRQVARYVSEASRGEDIVGSYGERFVAVLAGEEPEGAAVFAERVRAGIEFMELPSGKGCVLSAGVACYEMDSVTTGEELMTAAEKALQSALYAGGNRVIVHGSPRYREGSLAGVAEE